MTGKISVASMSVKRAARSGEWVAMLKREANAAKLDEQMPVMASSARA